MALAAAPPLPRFSAVMPQAMPCVEGALRQAKGRGEAGAGDTIFFFAAAARASVLRRSSHYTLSTSPFAAARGSDMRVPYAAKRVRKSALLSHYYLPPARGGACERRARDAATPVR